MVCNMVIKWGFLDELGFIIYGEDEDEVFLGWLVIQYKSILNEIVSKIDVVVCGIFDCVYVCSKQLLIDNIDKLYVMVEVLFQYEIIDVYQIDEIMVGCVFGLLVDWLKSGLGGLVLLLLLWGDMGLSKVGNFVVQS